jgi:hypothetical protein
MELMYIDDQFSQEEINQIYKEIKYIPYFFTESDRDELPPTGASSELSVGSYTLYMLDKKIQEILSDKNLKIFRAHVNCFVPNENPYFHIDTNDPNDISVLYYANPIKDYDIDLGGCTEFLNVEDNTLKSIFPLGGRICIFSANTYHRATPFRAGHRFVVNLRYHVE